MRKTVTLSTAIALIVVLAAAWHITTPATATAADVAKSQHPGMGPFDQYLMDRDAEIALAQSAAPESIARDAEVMVLGQKGFETAVKGKNGFVCMVQRSWSAPKDDPDFWNPKRRGPICFNPPAARSYLPLTIKRAELLLAGRSRDEMFAALATALDQKQLPEPEAGAMCYMMSKQGYLSERDGRWHPHLMFFAPVTDPALWGANAEGSPVIAFKDTSDRRTVFLVPVGKWSDGTDASQ